MPLLELAFQNKFLEIFRTRKVWIIAGNNSIIGEVYREGGRKVWDVQQDKQKESV